MRRLLIACSILVLASCARPEAPRPVAPAPKPAAERDVLDKLASEIDPGPQPAIWAQVPADVRTRVEASAPRERGAARLNAARDRLAGWSIQLSTTQPGELAPQLERAFEGVYLAEQLALSGDDTVSARDARALLWTFYNAFIRTQPLLRSFETAWGRASGTALGTSMDATELFASAGAKMSDRFAAEILKARAPERVVDDILWLYGSRKLASGDTEGGRALYTELVRRSRSAASHEDWVRIANAYIRIDDPRSATDAIARAKAAAAPTDKAAAQAAVRAAERDRDKLVRLQALPADVSPATQLTRFDLLLELDRGKEAESLLDALWRQRPKDARVRARMVEVRLRHGEFTEHLVEILRDEDLTDRNGTYWSMRAGTAGMAIARSTPSRAALAELTNAAKELAADEPARAAVLTFIVDRVAQVLDGKPDAASFLRAVRASFDDAVALRTKFGETPDADRLVMALALFTDPVRGLEAVLTRPKTTATDDPELYLQRANTAVTLAAFAGRASELPRARQAVEDIVPFDADGEGTREALLGDVEMLTATFAADRAAFARAATHYRAAKKMMKADRARLENNLGVIVSADDPARATAHFEAATREKTGRMWVPFLNQATAPGVKDDERLAIVRKLAGPPDSQQPPLLNVWRASLEPTQAEAKEAASRALTELDAPLSLHKVALHSKGIETEGTFGLGLGLRTGRLSHTLAASAYATLWFVRPMPLSRAELETKAKGGAAKPLTPPRKR